MKGLKGSITWQSESVLLEKRIFLFCFGEKCMSGRIDSFQKLNASNQFEIDVEFIEPDFFGNELVLGNNFTIREASRVLGKGEIKGIL